MSKWMKDVLHLQDAIVEIFISKYFNISRSNIYTRVNNQEFNKILSSLDVLTWSTMTEHSSETIHQSYKKET